MRPPRARHIEPCPTASWDTQAATKASAPRAASMAGWDEGTAAGIFFARAMLRSLTRHEGDSSPGRAPEELRPDVAYGDDELEDADFVGGDHGRGRVTPEDDPDEVVVVGKIDQRRR